MTLTTQRMTLAEFLDYDDGSEATYELENGELIAMPAESEINRRIAMFLLIHLSQSGIAPERLTLKTEIVVTGSRASVRIPDLMFLSEEGAAALEGAKRSTILPEMPPPLLAVEVVSPGQEKRDYRYKRSEYAARGIAEYWIVDPVVERVTVLTWEEGLYEEQVYGRGELIQSSVIEGDSLSVNRLLSGK